MGDTVNDESCATCDGPIDETDGPVDDRYCSDECSYDGRMSADADAAFDAMADCG